jgi:AcrR family transcriptional regulator
MDDIAARADLTKRALYQHFRSKDDLITAALAHSSELAIARLRGFHRPTNGDDLIDSFFTELAQWAAKPRWSGGGFTRVVVELADLRGHPAVRSRASTRQLWRNGLRTRSPPLVFPRRAIEHKKSCCSWKARWC